MTDTNIIIIIVAFVGAIAAIYVLYSIMLFQGNGKRGEDLQLSTKNILEQVKILFDKKEYAIVQLLATKYLERVPGHVEVRTYLAKAYFEDKKYNQAIKHSLILMRLKPDEIEAHKVLGASYVKKGVIPKAIQEYEYLFEHVRNDKDITRTLAELYQETEQYYSAISIYEVLSDMLEFEEDIAEVQAILAELNEETHNYPAAFEAYKRRLGILPNDIETNKKLAELYIKIKNYPVAIETLIAMLDFVTDQKALLWIYDKLVMLYEQTEDYDSAINYSERMLDIPGADNYKIRNNIASYNIKLNRFDEGIAILEDLTMMSQNAFDVTTALADAYKQQKEFKKALEKYTQLLDKAIPKEAKALNIMICDLYIDWAIHVAENEKYEESYEYLKNATQYNALNPEIYYNIAKNNFEQKNYATCVEALNKAIEYDRQNTNIIKYLLMLADAHHLIGNIFEEKKALTDLLKHDEKNAEGLYRVGLMFISQNEIKKAEESLQKAISYNPDLLAAKYNLALLYENNNRDKAKELYIEILEQDPSFEEAKNALNDLSSSELF